ncbi:MAG: hypoxanthine phosphoribosyltransferase [Planctomycetota bacterium]|nr:MAG: hypoxanthine phosphoribosyltransferase [Planctomycetota bacterium]
MVRTRISTEQIDAAVTALGQRITAEYAGRPLTILGVLTGSVMLVCDLMRRIELPHQLGMIQASSYRGTATSPGELILNTEFLPNLRGRDVLLVDDIFDTGRTMAALLHVIRQKEPASVRSVTLLWKRVRSQVDFAPDYYCFEIPDEFVVGYGLDFNGEYRHLPYIGVLDE